MKSDKYYEEALLIASRENPDYSKAANLLEKAAKLGSADALSAIASWYYFGRHYKKNVETAIDYWEKSAAGLNIESIHALARIYEFGIDRKKSLSTAFYHYSKAALLNDGEGCYEVARFFEHGIYVSQNKLIAELWYDKAEELGYTELEDKINAAEYDAYEAEESDDRNLKHEGG